MEKMDIKKKILRSSDVFLNLATTNIKRNPYVAASRFLPRKLNKEQTLNSRHLFTWLYNLSC